MTHEIIVVSYGGGTNSTAILEGMRERDMRPDLIMFADTGSEKPGTYEHLEAVQKWLTSIGFPQITIVKNDLPQGVIDGSLFNECYRLGTLPAKVFGRSSCSMKWKVEPQQKYLKRWMRENSVKHIQHVIGYDADEIHRMQKAEKAIAEKKADDPNFRNYETNRYLLIEWDWGRDECIDAIARAGLPQPGKSACFMCPSSKKPEVIWLKTHHPVLYNLSTMLEKRALNGEGQAPVARVDGLGRHWNWATFGGSDVATPETDCGCYDGDAA